MNQAYTENFSCLSCGIQKSAKMPQTRAEMILSFSDEIFNGLKMAFEGNVIQFQF